MQKMQDLKKLVEGLEMSRLTGEQNVPFDKIFEEIRPYLVKVRPQRLLTFQRIVYGLFEYWISDRLNAEKHGYLTREDLKVWWTGFLRTEAQMMKAYDAGLRSAHHSKNQEKLDKMVREIQDYMIGYLDRTVKKGGKDSYAVMTAKIYGYVRSRNRISGIMNSLKDEDFEKKSTQMTAAILSAYRLDGDTPKHFMMAILNRMENPWTILSYAKDLEHCLKNGYNDLEKFFLNDIHFILTLSNTYKEGFDFNNRAEYLERVKNIQQCIMSAVVAYDGIMKFGDFSSSENWRRGMNDFQVGLRSNLEIVATFVVPAVRFAFPVIENVQKNTTVTGPDMNAIVPDDVWTLLTEVINLLNVIRIASFRLDAKNIYFVPFREVEHIIDSETKMRVTFASKNKQNLIEHTKRLYPIIKKMKESDAVIAVLNRLGKFLEMNGQVIPQVL